MYSYQKVYGSLREADIPRISHTRGDKIVRCAADETEDDMKALSSENKMTIFF